ncbi:serine/threonine-protein kinase [Nocardia inohanensis]|uniref:serine/threonine-protein kinase n=1 Tax=Nocardia inohanensis TaxID=209246 RepID=UPI000A846275|nr:serine/threonine-protein kinase [Nocardia inohanensis]
MSVGDTTESDIARVRAALPGYDVGGQVGRGGCGVVLAGVHRGLNRRVAIKRIPAQFAGDTLVRRRFVDEARVMAGLDHPHVVPVYDYIEHEELCLLVLEYLPGGTVENRFITAGFEATAAVAVALSCAAGLNAAHRNGILHRDVKPSNLMFSANGTLKLTDFGIAKIVGGEDTLVTRAGEIIGTPSYIAPEQVRGQQLSPATDVYALATMLYQLLSGALPFPPGEDALAMLFAHAYGDPVPLAEVAPFVPDPIAEVVMRGLAPDPAARFESAESFGIALAEPAAFCWGTGWLTPVGIPLVGADTIAAAATGGSRPFTPGPAGGWTPHTPPPGGAPGPLHDPYAPTGNPTRDSPTPQPGDLHRQQPRRTANPAANASGARGPSTPAGMASGPDTGGGRDAEFRSGTQRPYGPASGGSARVGGEAEADVPTVRSFGAGGQPTIRSGDQPPFRPDGPGNRQFRAGPPATSGAGRSTSQSGQGVDARQRARADSGGERRGPARDVERGVGRVPAAAAGGGWSAGPLVLVRPRQPIQHEGARLIDVDRGDLVPVQQVVRLKSARLPLLAGVVGAVLVGAVAVLGIGGGARDVPPAGMIRVSGVDPGSVTRVDVDLSQPVPVTISGGDADAVKLSWDVLGVPVGGETVTLPGGGGEVGVSAPVNQYVVAGDLTGQLTLSRNGSDTATYRFGVHTAQRSLTTAAAFAILLLMLFATAYAESNSRALRHGHARFASTVGLAVSAGLLGVAAVGAAWVLLGTEPTVAAVIACAAGGVAAGLAFAAGLRRVGKRYRYVRVLRLREGLSALAGGGRSGR